MLEAILDQGLDVSGIPRDRLLRNWGLIDDADGEYRLTVAGVLLLARSPQRFFPHVYVSALRIPGVDIATPPIDQKRIEGRLFDLLSDGLRFLDFHLMRRHRIRGLEPEVVLEFPVACLRETLVNAIAHRDYTIAGPVRLLVFDDRVEVRVPGGLPNSVRLDQLPAGVHVLRNPTVYNRDAQTLRRGGHEGGPSVRERTKNRQIARQLSFSSVRCHGGGLPSLSERPCAVREHGSPVAAREHSLSAGLLGRRSELPAVDRLDTGSSRTGEHTEDLSGWSVRRAERGGQAAT